MMPHGWCYQWDWSLIVTNIVADLIIFVCYFSIPVLLWGIRKYVKSILIGWFAIFIFSCGVGHLIDIVVIFSPMYWLQASNRIITAIASVATLLLLKKIVKENLK